MAWPKPGPIWSKTRWSDDLEKFVGGVWIDVATDAELWRDLEEGFVQRLQ